jgi:hypothetical protein
MKKHIWLVAFPVLIISCKKESENNPSPTPSLPACVVTEVRDSVGNKMTASYEYDVNRRITKMYDFDYSNGTKTGYSTFAFSGNRLTITGYKMDNSPNGSLWLATLNASGSISSYTRVRPDTSNGIIGTVKDTTVFTYNSNGQMLTNNQRGWKRDANGNFISLFFLTQICEYLNERVSKAIFIVSQSNSNGYQYSSNDTTMYTYDNSSSEVTTNPIIFGETTIGLFGKLVSNRIPVKSESSNSKATYTATIDSKGNPTKIRSTYDYGNGFIQSYTKVYSNYCP